MHILLDGRTIKDNPSGLGLWNIRLTEHLLQHQTIDHISLLISSKSTFDFVRWLKDQDCRNKLTLMPAMQTYEFIGVKRLWFEQVILSQMIQKVNPNIYHASDSFGIPFFKSHKTKYLLTIHDLIPISPFRENMTIGKTWLYNLSINIAYHAADAITAISDDTKTAIEKNWKKSPKTLSVIYDGVDTINNDTLAESQRRWHTLSKEHNLIDNAFLFYYGGFSPRRKVMRYLDIFSRLRKERKIPAGYKLVLSGRIKGAQSHITRQYETVNTFIKQNNLEDKVVLLDYLNTVEKTALALHSALFLYLSLNEGFGLPAVEVARLKKPILATRTGIWASYVKQCPFLVDDPTDDEDCYKKLYSLLQNKYTQSQLESLSTFTQQFSWERMALEYIKQYQLLLNSKPT